MKKIIVLLTALFLTGCKKEKELDENFREIVIQYQKKFPIPDLHKGNYVYISYFNVVKGDTRSILSRSSNGLIPKVKGFGIFQDDILQPFFVYDDKDLSKNFIYKRVKNETSKKFYLDL